MKILLSIKEVATGNSYTETDARELSKYDVKQMYMVLYGLPESKRILPMVYSLVAHSVLCAPLF